MAETPEEPAVAPKGPYKIELLAGCRYAWCACGLSRMQPFCDGTQSKR
jgi:CDGSH-type Zn-finger protein